MDNNNKNNHNNDNSYNNNNINNTTRHHHITTNNRSMSDTDSQYDEFHSPLRSPLQQDDLPPSSPSKAIIPVHYPQQKPVQPLTRPPTVLSYNLATREEPVTGVTKVNPGSGGGGGGEEGQGGERRVRTTTPLPPTRRVKREVAVERVGLGFRVMEAVLCLIAFSVMVSDKTQGWSGDSFDRYKEYRYVVAVNAIAFAYAAFQAIEMTYRLIYKKHIVSFSLRPVFDFLIDQILAYLLISASSSAATRVDDWVSNWGKDDFTEMATASIGMSFLAFVAFAVSSLISGYILCNQKSL